MLLDNDFFYEVFADYDVLGENVMVQNFRFCTDNDLKHCINYYLVFTAPAPINVILCSLRRLPKRV